MTTDPIAAALPVCAGISYQLGVAGYFEASDYLQSDYMRGYVAATLADALEAERAKVEKWREAAGAHHVAAMKEAEKWIAASAERDGLREELAETLIQTGDLKIALAGAEAQAAAAYEAAAGAASCCPCCQDDIRALTPADAQATLDKLLAEARLEGRKIERQAQDAIFRRVNPSFGFALPEPKEASHG